ncbi:MAG: lysine--tRNA ligase [Acidimicrobiia bacterium]|nr:lysine--tRNA ligase [Acidimicrobiia bacterium]MBV8985308.1 lysine--tRNA ligase [Acidimicrobiia bacterium]MBV9042690.1 lysine--tRNA ligase [Acidimicrobiia bacterium]MBV9283939.1 lysine--tRNA ligase [Acidimicrobiia bacterium]
MSDLPYRFEPTATAAELHERFDSLDAGAETDDTVTIAGRLLLRRVQGKLAFGQLQDSTGRIQLFCPAQVTERFEEFGNLDLGDWIGATGEMMKTRKGELSVRVREWVLLAKARRQFPDKWHGLSDVDTRYRQRYVDLWVTDEARRAFQIRSQVVSSMRRRLEAQGFVEVETPLLHAIPGGALARPFITHHNTLDIDLYLRIAIELHLKRLVVGGLERVFEIGRVFRNEGIDPRHNPEFTMLELYQAYADYEDMMRLTEELVAGIAEEVVGTTRLTYGGQALDLTPPWRRATMNELIAEHAGVEVDLEMDVDALRKIASGFDVPVDDDWGPGKLILEIYEKTTESELWGPVFVTDYPQEVSPLARAHRSKPGYVERFEPIVAGRELGNAFTELTDPDEQRARFEEQARLKAAGDEEAMIVDEDYLRALEYGLPPTGGLGIGIDRLVMLLSDAQNIRDVILFPTLRPEQER